MKRALIFCGDEMEDEVITGAGSARKFEKQEPLQCAPIILYYFYYYFYKE